MSIQFKNLARVLSLLTLLTAFIPLNQAVSAAAPLPPVAMFQLPWEQGLSWVALDGFDNGSDRSLGSPHNYLNGGAIDFAPHNNMRKGENTSNFWVTAAADGTIVEISKCHMKIAHASGWVTEYQHLANLQVKLGDVVARNQKLAIIANAASQPVCPGSEPPDIPHLHFVLRPNMVGATFAGWEFKYSSFWNVTTFKRNGVTLGLFKPLLNALDVPPTITPTIIPSSTVVSPPTDTPTPPAGPYVSTVVSQPNININEIAAVTVNLNNVPVEGYTSAEFTCTYNASLVEVSNIVIGGLFGPDAVSAIHGPQNGSFIVAVAGSNGNKATASGTTFTFDVKGLQSGQTALDCAARVSKGDNVLTVLPSVGTSVNVLGAIPTTIFTETPTSSVPIPTSTPIAGLTTTPVPNDWLTFTNSTFGFQFRYPSQGVIENGQTDTFARIDLPFAPGTNLHEKYLQVDVGENANPCRSPVAASSITNSSSTVMINGMSFLKEVGGDAAAGNLYQFIAYSTSRNNVCVSLSLVLHSLNPGNSTPTEVPFDFAAEIVVVDQIVGTYMWLAVAPTATPIDSPTPTLSPSPTAEVSATPTFTAAPTESPTSAASATATQISGAVLTGQVFAAKTVTVRLYDSNQNLATSANVNPDGTFRFEVAAGDYTIVATANGFLRIQGSVTLAEGETRAMPVVTLLAGDIDDDNSIDQFDAMTIGFNYGSANPPGADLNSDGIINVIDLELLAKNYRKTGPVVW